ncbi:MAG: NADH dehydrogenase subunit, partial [Clostridia bacterium]|nr:NADH dehydrogenase subunit [Clostridia bacterium]
MKIEIPLGPQHPALKEPENFMLVLDGEMIVDATINLGYNHRGVEKAAENRNYIQDIYLIER